MSSVITLLRVLRIRNGNFNLASTVQYKPFQAVYMHMVGWPTSLIPAPPGITR